MTLTPLTLGLAGVAGLALGSFAVTSGLRMSRGDSALRGRSRCDACGEPLGFARTLPVISFVSAGGACQGCRARIDPTHLAGEVAGAAIVLSSLLAGDAIRSALLAVLGLTLVAAVTVDARIRRLPDGMTALVAVTGLAASTLSSTEAALTGLAAAGLSAAILLALRVASQRLRGDPGLGLGDVKLVAALALWLGAATPWLVVVASLVGLIAMVFVRPADGRLAFGPALAVAAWLVGMFQEAGAWPMTM